MNADILKCSSSCSFFTTYEFFALYLQTDAMYFTMQQVIVRFDSLTLTIHLTPFCLKFNVEPFQMSPRRKIGQISTLALKPSYTLVFCDTLLIVLYLSLTLKNCYLEANKSVLHFYLNR